jgi:XRE family aerobic/anaerobic benzoate catabolism transcriptional regulator
MSRRVLATQSEVSERHIAQLEAGAGNISLLLLHRLAAGLGMPVEELITVERRELPRGARLLERLLERLAPEQLDDARQFLLERFQSGDLAPNREKIALVGLRGAGKSTLGHLLGKARGMPFLELDREVERLSNMELSDVFEIHGQEGFRRLEREALAHVIASHDRVVIATGGGLVTEPASFELLLSNCLTVWIKASPEEHMARVIAQGDSRPMADDKAHAMDDLKAILASREKLYAQADIVLDTTGCSVEEALARLETLLRPS